MKRQRLESSELREDDVAANAALTLTNMAKSAARLHASVLHAAAEQNHQTTSLLEQLVRENNELVSEHTNTLQQNLALSRAHHALRLERDVLQADHVVATTALQVAVKTAGESVGAQLASLRVADQMQLLHAAEKHGFMKENQLLRASFGALYERFLAQVRVAQERSQRLQQQIEFKDVQLAELTSQNEWLARRLADCQAEVVSVLSVLQEVGNSVKQHTNLTAELKEARTHVKVLERQLSLEGIVQAVLSKESLAAIAEELSNASAPDPSLKLVAPDFFALRVLEHKDLTVSEVVQQWEQQRSQLRQQQNVLSQRQEELDKLQQEASRVHFLFTEERRRRASAEERIGELQRRRVGSSAEETKALFDQLASVHSALSMVRDTNALLTVQLQDVRHEAAQLSAKNAELVLRLDDLESHLRADTVAQTLGAMKLQYERSVEGYERHLRHATAERELAVQTLAQCQSFLSEGHQQLEELSSTNASLVNAVKAHEERSAGLTAQLAELRSFNWEAAVQQLRKTTATNVAGTTAQNMTLIRRKTDETIAGIEDLVRKTQALATAVANNKNGHASRSKSDSNMERVQIAEREAQDQFLQQTATSLLQFTEAQLQSSNALRGYFLDLSASEAECLLLLQQQLEASDGENRQLREKLAHCEELIERHSLTAVEGVLSANGAADTMSSSEGASSPTTTGGAHEAVSEEVTLLTSKVQALELQQQSLVRDLEERDQRCMSLATDLAVAKAAWSAATRSIEDRDAELTQNRAMLASMAAELHVSRARYEELLPRATAATAEDATTEDSLGRATGLSDILQRLETIAQQIVTLSLPNHSPTTDHNETSGSAAETKEGEEEGGDPMEGGARRTVVESTIHRTLQQDGLLSVASVLNDIYEVAGLIRKTRAAAAGEQANSEHSAQQSMLVGTLTARCTSLEDAIKQKDTTLSHLQQQLNQKEKVHAESMAAVQAKQATVEMLEKDLAKCQSLKAQADAETANQRSINEKLLALVKKMQASSQAGAPPSSPATGPAAPPPPA